LTGAQLSNSPADRTIPPRAVIFDIGRVIIGLDLKRALAPFSTALANRFPKSSGIISPEDTWRLIQTDPRWPDWQEGRLAPREWHEYLTDRLHISLNFTEFCDAWNRVLEPETMISDDVFAALGSRCRLALLSNTDPIHVESLERDYAFPRHFAVRIYSCAVGCSKPSPAIFQAALRALDVSAGEALYVDDIPDFVAAARRLGLDGIVFREPKRLIEELSRRGLLP
jgi:glucose-1-phosphatase